MPHISNYLKMFKLVYALIKENYVQPLFSLIEYSKKSVDFMHHKNEAK